MIVPLTLVATHKQAYKIQIAAAKVPALKLEKC
jgi:hypothetical protein